MKNPETDLDRALATSSRTGDPEVDELASTAGSIAQALALPAPRQAQDRALFIEAVAGRKRSLLSRIAAPSIAIAATFIVLAALGRGALPGEALYPVNQVLRTAGLAGDPVVGIERDLEDARLLIERALNASEGSSARAETLAVSALMKLGQARDHLRALEPRDRPLYEVQIESLTDRALDVIRLNVRETADDRDDNSGPGGGEDDSDNSGSGSENSGSGSDDSDDDSDNSGSGSDDSGSDDSGSDDSDNSGSGSNSSGSGSGDDADDRADELEDRADDKEDALEDEQDDD